jgi:hypothetical protein
VTPITKRFVHRLPEAIEQIRGRHWMFCVTQHPAGEISPRPSTGSGRIITVTTTITEAGPRTSGKCTKAIRFWGSPPGTDGATGRGKVLYKGLFATYPGFTNAQPHPALLAPTFPIQKLRSVPERLGAHRENGSRSGAVPGTEEDLPRPVELGNAAVAWAVVDPQVPERLVRRPMANHWRLAVRAEPGDADSRLHLI